MQTSMLAAVTWDRIQGDLLLWLPICFFAVIVFFLWKTISLMPRVKPKTLSAKSSSTVRWDDVAGLGEAKEELNEVVEFMREPGRFRKLGARVPKGILLYGPPGTGKTLLAKAVAHESGAAFFSQSASSFVEMFAGLGAARIRKLFAEARKHAPAIVFIDELDAVGAARGGHGLNREQDQTLNQLLVELDGFEQGSQVVVMGASNRLQDLDPALLRPGRFDRQILVGQPDLAGREAILNVHCAGKPLAGDVDLHTLARQSAGLTGADLANICNEAAIHAGRLGKDAITHADFDHALERVVAGLQQRKVVTEKEKRILAFHEGGHALMSHLMGDAFPVQKATIVARGQALGYTLNLPAEDRYLHTREELIDWMTIALAGRAAEQIVFGRVTNGAANDLEKVTEIARSMVFEWGMSETVTSRTMRADNYALSEETKRLRDSEQARLTDHAYEVALRLLQKHRAALDRVAGALLDKETLSRDELLALFADVEPESQSSETVGAIRALPATPDGLQ
ncbi:MAG TPA: ATP-dependent zinc metalloprotease FtsH [Gaiellaceae bacterium]|nr:ATP-dependent zinc metalloprotease FtsH [Gaiellaceae bacterium]